MNNIVNRLLRRATRRGLVAVVAAALLAPLVVAQPAGAGPAIDGTAAHLTAAGDTPIEDRSMEMPGTRHNEVTGDFLKRGYDQRMIVEEDQLNIYDADTRGGALLRSTQVDLYVRENEQDIFFSDELIDSATANSIRTTQIAWTPDALFMAGTTDDGMVVYRLPPDGSCAQESCALWVKKDFQDQNRWGMGEYVGDFPNGHFKMRIAPSALAAVVADGKTVVAMGTTYSLTENWGGIYLIDGGTGQQMGNEYSDVFWRSDDTMDAQSVVTALDLDWNPSGNPRGVLTMAVMHPTHGTKLAAIHYDTFGFFIKAYASYDNSQQTMPHALSVAMSRRPDGSRVAAFGMEDGSVLLWDPTVTSKSLLGQAGGSASAPVDALTFTDRFDGSVGVPDLVAVSSRGNSAQVLRYNGTLTPLPLAGGGGTSTSVGGIRGWFPGYKTGQVSFSNDTTSDSTIQLDFATRPNASYGCWFSKKFQDGVLPLPTTPAFLDNGAGQSVFSIATLTAGDSGGCGATDFTGQWAAYVRVTPVGRPADRTVAKLVWSRSGQLSVQSVGGSLDLVVQQDTSSVKPLGVWNISIQSPPPPGSPASIKVTGTRLDPAGTTQPVYRIDVPATTWSLPSATPPRLQTVLPPLEVHGITDIGDDVSLGLLVPQGQPSRATSGSFTLSPVSFYWQNPSPIDGSTITDVYVQAGSTSSNRVNLAGLPAPAAGTTVGQVTVCPTTGSQKCDATADPFANGLDQAKLMIQVYDATATQVLPISNPVYGRIYYRDQNDDLLTGLIPEDGSAYTRVSPYAGAYPNDGSTAAPVRPPTNGIVGGRFGYLSTSTTDQQQITAHVGGSAEASAPIVLEAVDFTPTVQPGAQAAQGFYLTGCHDYSGNNYCRLAAITTTRPGLFLTTDADSGNLQIGLQFTTAGSAGPSQPSVQAQTSLTSLPLQQVANQAEHTVAAAQLNITNGELSLDTTSGFQPADTIDTWIISHGTQIPVRNVRVGGGN